MHYKDLIDVSERMNGVQVKTMEPRVSWTIKASKKNRKKRGWFPTSRVITFMHDMIEWITHPTIHSELWIKNPLKDS